MANNANLFRAVAMAAAIVCAAVLPPAQVACASNSGATASPITDLIHGIALSSAQLQSVAASINPDTDAPLFLLGQGSILQVITTLDDFADKANTAVPMLLATPALDFDAANAVFDSFRQFVDIHQQLLNILFGKSSLFSTVPYVGAPIAKSVRRLEASVDAVAILLSNIAPSRGSDVKTQNDKLHAAFEKIATAYLDVTIPIARVELDTSVDVNIDGDHVNADGSIDGVDVDLSAERPRGI